MHLPFTNTRDTTTMTTPFPLRHCRLHHLQAGLPRRGHPKACRRCHEAKFEHELEILEYEAQRALTEIDSSIYSIGQNLARLRQFDGPKRRWLGLRKGKAKNNSELRDEWAAVMGRAPKMIAQRRALVEEKRVAEMTFEALKGEVEERRWAASA